MTSIKQKQTLEKLQEKDSPFHLICNLQRYFIKLKSVRTYHVSVLYLLLLKQKKSLSC